MTADKRFVGETPLIELTRLNGASLVLNSDLIQYMESSPDTTLTLINGEKLVVSESTAQIVALTLEYRARLIAEVARQSPGGLVVASGSLWQANAAIRAAAAEEDADADPYAVRRHAGDS